MGEQTPRAGRIFYYRGDGTLIRVVEDDDIEGFVVLGEAVIDLAEGAPRLRRGERAALSRATAEAERRRRARARKAETAAPAMVLSPRWPELEAALVDCPDPANHKVCPKTGDGHEWCKPHPRPADHKYQCEDCGHYDLDDYM